MNAENSRIVADKNFWGNYERAPASAVPLAVPPKLDPRVSGRSPCSSVVPLFEDAMVRRRRRVRTLVFSLFVLVDTTSVASAQRIGGPPRPTRTDTTPHRRAGIIDGVVTDTNLVPLAGAQVAILRTELKLLTGPNGRFRFVGVPSGGYILVVRRLGFRPASHVVDVQPPDTIRLAYMLERAVVGLDTVVIAARRQSLRMQQFEDRRKAGFGEFLSEEEIKNRNAVYTTEVLRRFKSINISPSYNHGSMAEWYALSRREGGSVNPGTGEIDYCPLQVMVDGMPMPTPFNLDILPSPRELAGIEVYNGAATLPPQFGGADRRCGMILIWTKDGY
jgi:hypothetical protein